MTQILSPEPISAIEPEVTRRSRRAKPPKVAKVKAAKAPKASKVEKKAARAARPKKSILKYELIAKKVKPAELMNFSRQAASFIRAGIPLLDALSTIAEEMEDKLLKSILEDVSDRLRRGTSLAGGIAHHAKGLPGYYVPMLRSAELTGRLDEVLDQLAAYLARDIESRRKVKSALTYPAVIAGMAVLTVVAMALFVLPQFKSFFAGLGAELPISTRMLLAVTNSFSVFGKQMMFGTIAMVVGTFVALKTDRGKMRKDKIMLRLPSLGRVINYAIVERFCRILSVMVQAGVPLPDAMAVATECTNNRLFQKRLTVARDEMIRGGGLARPIIATGLFPSAANQMIRVGESTGTLDQQLEVASDFLGTELDYRLKKFTDMFEPVIIVAMGLVVGFVAVALVQAMYGVYSQADL